MKNEIQNCTSVIVGALIVNKNGKVLLAESKKWKGMYTVLGGHVNFGEKLEDAVLREVKEESGMDVKVEDKLNFEQSVFDKKFHEGNKHFVFLDYLCSYNGEEDEPIFNGEFTGKYEWISPEEAIKKIKMPHGTETLIKRYLKYKEATDYLVGWKRCQADFENYKKRQAENNKDSIRYATQNIVMQILPVLDNFQSSVEHIPKEQKDGAWVQGIMYIQRQLEMVLLENGIEEIKTDAGDNFDTKFHEAIADKECSSCKSEKKFQNKIKKVILKGYKIEEKVIRPAKVIVE